MATFLASLGIVAGVSTATIALTAPAANAAVAAGDVVYLKANNNPGIYLRHASDGSSSQIPGDPSAQYPDISPDGSRIAYYGSVVPGTAAGIAIMNSNGSGVREAAGGVNCEDNLPWEDCTSTPPHGYTMYGLQWSPNGQSIAFTKYSGATGIWRVKVVNITTGVQTTAYSGSSQVYDVTWSPDGTRLAYDAYGPTGFKIHVVDVNGANDHELPSGFNDYSPAWSHDGSRIYVASSQSGGCADCTGIVYFTYTGSGAPFSGTSVARQVLTTESNYKNDRSPRVSANNATIYFMSNGYTSTTDATDLYMISASGGTPTQLTVTTWDAQLSSPSPVLAAYPATQPANSTVAIAAPTSHDAYGVRQVTVGLSATGNMRYDLGWSTSATTAPTGNFQTITNMTTRTGPLNFMGVYSGSGTVWNGGTQPDQIWYLWVRSVKTNGTANAWGTPLPVRTPKAGLLVGVGDSFLSGHHHDSDERYCPNAADAPLYPGNIPCSIAGAPLVQPNDYAFSWLPKTALTMSSTLHLSANWQIISKNAALSGASAQSFGDATFAPGSSSWAAPGTQADAIRAELYPRYNSWSYLAFTGGSDDTNWISVMTSWYINHFASAYGPWAVPTANGVTDCPDTQSVYTTLGAGSPTLNATITSNLQGLMTIASSVSPGVRGLNVDYPYVEDNTSICYNDSGAWHGVKSVVDLLHADHAAVTGSNVKLIDLRANFGATPVASGYLQLTRLYGYPHPSGSVTSSTPGQTRIANAVAAVATGTSW